MVDGQFTITNILNQWANIGVFAYVLPFLMIFAVVFGILNKTKLLGENKGVQAIIALTMGLLSLQFDYVANFFAVIFPYTGIGIAVLLIGLILMGLSFDQPMAKWVWFYIGLIIFIVIILSSWSSITWWGGGHNLGDAWPAILAGIFVILVVILAMFGDRLAGRD
jgi:uncharacterized membrane protein